MNNYKALSESKAVKCGKSFSVYSSVDSTNNLIKKMSAVLPDGHLIIADEQLSGRGRQGKRFYSPNGEGLYMSLLFKNPRDCSDELFTAKISLAVCRAVDRITCTDNNNGVGIKWVNDIYFGGKKLCGILCERFSAADGEKYVVAGIGLNIKLNGRALPSDISQIATSLYDITRNDYDKYVIAAFICEELEKVMNEEFTPEEAIAEYKRRSVVIGREITVHVQDENIRAAALDICEDGALLVRTEDGYTKKLRGGEISVRVKQR